MEYKIFGPFGRCIYCLCDDPKQLTDEHIVPRCLNGTAYIKKGSCRTCAEKIKPVETFIGRDMFNEARVYLGIKGRRPKNRPTHFSLKVTFPDRTEIRQIPAAEVPWHFAMPVFPTLPGLMIGQSLGNSWSLSFSTYGMPGNAEFLRALKEEGATDVGFTKSFRIALFNRQLAKIGHCFAVATKGLDYFKPLSVPLILGEDDSNVADLVGGVSTLEPHIEGRLHLLQLEEGNLNGRDFVVVRIRLFAHVNVGGIGVPTYYVVVGEPLKN